MIHIRLILEFLDNSRKEKKYHYFTHLQMTLLFAVGSIVCSILFSLALAGTPAPIDPLVCTERSDAVAVVAAACSIRVDCDFEWLRPTPLSALAWDTLLVTQTELISPSATAPGANDVRFMFTLPNYVTLPLVAYDNMSLDAVDCAPIAAAPQTLVPPSVFSLIDALSTWERYDLQTNQCPDDNYVGIYSNASGNATIVCVCAPGKLCEVDPVTLNSLLSVTAIIAVVSILAMALNDIISGAIKLRWLYRLKRRVARLERAYYDGNKEDDMMMKMRPMAKDVSQPQPSSSTKRNNGARMGALLAVGGDYMSGFM